MNDGRNIDPTLGTLSGEAASQKTGTRQPEETRSLRRAFGDVSPQAPQGADPTYYGHPVVKKSVWSADIPLYYYVGGVAGGAAVLGAAATLAGGREEFPHLIPRTRWIGAIGSGLSAALLIHDLGRPGRFVYMLRVFRPSSPMNMGSWILSGFATLSGLAAVTSRQESGPVRLVSDGAAIGAGLFGLLLSGYTGVLVSNTTIPVWQRPHRTLPLLFLASAVASASSLLQFLSWNRREERAILVFGALGKLADLGCSHLSEKQIESVPEAVAPLREGLSGFLWKAGKALSIASLILSLAPGTSRNKTRWAGVMGSVGAMCLRFGVHHAGQRSAENPRAVFHQQRSGQGAFEITGKAAITGPGGQRACS